MDLNRIIARVLGLLLASALFNQCLAENSVTLERQAWPAARQCDGCVPVQFGKLDMRLPLTEIGKILVINSQASALSILPRSGAAKELVMFLSVEPDMLLKRYEELGLLRGLGVTTNEQLFDAIGKLPGENESLAILRKINGIAVASRYIKMSKGPVHVYWIQSPLPGNSQDVYFVIDGEETVYQLAGNVYEQFLDAVLSNLQITEAP